MIQKTRLISLARLSWVVVGIFALATTARASPSDLAEDLATIRVRFVEDLLQRPFPARFDPGKLIATLRPDGSWPGIDYEDLSRTGFRHADHLDNLRFLSQALRREDSGLFRSPQLRSTILAALDFWFRHDFMAENWWWNEIGTPDRLANTMLLIDEALSSDQRKQGSKIMARASLDGVGARPGGDLIKIAGVIGKRAILERDPQAFQEAVRVMAAEVRVTTGRGIQADLSLQHRTDRVTSTLTYGYGFAASFADYAIKLQGTRFSFPTPAMELLIDFYLDGIHQSMAHGLYAEPSQLNRGISRGSPMQPRSSNLPQKLAQASTYRQAELRELIQVRNRQQTPSFTFNKFFWNSEYLSHQRSAYFASVRMYSTRNHSLEAPYNQEGLRNHFLADGSSFIIRTGQEYADVFSVYDWRKIPGTTVVQKPAFPSPTAIPQRGRTDFVGGVSDGMYGAAVFDFQSPIDSLHAKKAWFFFDREFVGLGSGIRSDDPYPVATTLNQSLLVGDVAVQDGPNSLVPHRGEHLFTDVKRVWHDGTAYLFPTSTTVRLKNDVASGNRRNISHQPWATDEEIERDVFTLWIDYGTRPRDAAYGYIVVPDIAAHEITDYEAQGDISIVANSSTVQAVTHRSLGLSQIVFHRPGDILLPGGIRLSADQPCLVMLQASGGEIKTITAADPARKHASLQLRTNASLGNGSGDHWQTRWNSGQNQTVISIDLPSRNSAGQSRIITFPNP